MKRRLLADDARFVAVGTTPEIAASSAVLAANQGLYNGFLAVGLLWALVSYGVRGGRAILTFFLLCVLVAGIYGGATANPRILFVQGVPALVGLALVWAARGSSAHE